MDIEISYTFGNPAQFWSELRDLVSSSNPVSSGEVATTVRRYVNLVGNYKEKFLSTYADLEACTSIFIDSEFFKSHANHVYVRLVAGLQDEKNPKTFNRAFKALILVRAGITTGPNNTIFQSLYQSGLLKWLTDVYIDVTDDFFRQTITKLMYEVTRRQALTVQDLTNIGGPFLTKILDYSISEYEEIAFATTDDQATTEDKTNHSFGLLLALNEQYLHYNAPGGVEPINNRVISFLHKTPLFNNFSSSIIAQLNRETLLEKQNLILQLLYSLFSFKETCESFYTTDIPVAIDVLIRQIYNLPDDSTDTYTVQLRHLYLRVLHLLFQNSQLKKDPTPYKPEEVHCLLGYLIGRSDPDPETRTQTPPTLPITTTTTTKDRKAAPPPPPSRYRSPLPSPKPSPALLFEPPQPPPSSQRFIPTPPPPRRGAAALAPAPSSRLAPPPPPAPRSRSRSRPRSSNGSIGSANARGSPRVGTPTLGVVPSSFDSPSQESTYSHFQPFDSKTRELASRCFEAYEGMYASKK